MVTKLSSSTTWVNRWEVSSETDPDKTYVVGQKTDGSWGCGCPRWRFSKAPRPDCKHILGIKVTEPVDRKRTSKKAAEEFVRMGGRSTETAAEPVFLLQTRRSIQLKD